MNADPVNAFSSAVRRCLVAVDYARPLPSVSPGVPLSKSFHDDYTFHDQVESMHELAIPCSHVSDSITKASLGCPWSH